MNTLVAFIQQSPVLLSANVDQLFDTDHQLKTALHITGASGLVLAGLLRIIVAAGALDVPVESVQMDDSKLPVIIAPVNRCPVLHTYSPHQIKLFGNRATSNWTRMNSEIERQLLLDAG